MINDLNALTEYTINRGEKTPRLKGQIVLSSPGCDQDSIAKIKNALPNMAESYLSCAQAFNLNGICLGFFQLSPPGSKKLNFVERLVQINTPEKNPFWIFMSENGLYEVATWEAEPICVATNKSSHKEGSVLKISIAQPSPKEDLLAPNFETFLLIAGNLDAIRDEYSRTENIVEARAEFELCLTHYELPNEALTAWKNISSVVLSS